MICNCGVMTGLSTGRQGTSRELARSVMAAHPIANADAGGGGQGSIAP